ncbi:MAG: TonB-dependent receptor, partial [Armatimonadetes bacterium]
MIHELIREEIAMSEVIGKNRLATGLLLTGSALALAVVLASAAHAREREALAEIQTAPAAQTQAQSTKKQQGEEESSSQVEEIVVTGSRIRKSEFTSISPIQVINVDQARDLGVVSFDDILAVGSSVTSGVQFDTNIANNFVTTNGPGTSTISLRGLGADRTLVLINGRRFAPSGVGGAPSNPDTNLIPTLMIERVEVLLDGAGSVYGSDAVAGVVNVLLKKDFEGLMVDGITNITEHGGGFSARTGMIFGAQGERGGFTFAGEYFRQKELRVFDRPRIFTSRDDGAVCHRDLEINAETGKLAEDTCAGTIGSIAVLPIFTPAPGIISFSGAGPFGAFPAVRFKEGNVLNLFGVPIPNFAFALLDEDQAPFRHGVNNFQEEQLIAPLERYTTYFNGHYRLTDHVEVYAEAGYSNLRGSNDGGKQQIFPTIPGLVEQLDENGDVVGLVPNPLNPFGQLGLPVTIVAFINDTGNLRFEREQYRLFGGLRGDLGFLGVDWLGGWEYDLSAGYTRSLGVTATNVVLEDRLSLSLNTLQVDANGNPVCGRDLQGFTDFFGFLDDIECVPVNFFTKDLLVNRNLTPEERAWLIGETSTRTSIAESLISGYVTGDLPIEVPGGPVAAAFGFEWREDSFLSDGDTVREKGNGAGFFSEADSRGSVTQWELYGEVSIPLLKGKPLVHDLTLEAAGRFVNNEFFSSTAVWSVRLGYSPVSWLTLKGNAGSSFRSPNLNFLFLGEQSGFLGGAADPCDTPPPDANGEDPRSQTVIDNCIAQGIDPFDFNSPGIEVFSTGSPDLKPERSFSWSVGGSVSQPWFQSFNLQLAATYWEIEVKNGIARPGGATILSACHESPNLSSVFCTRFERDPVTHFVTRVDNTPFNLGRENVRGLDLTMAFDKGFKLLGRDFTVGANGAVTRIFEDSSRTVVENDVIEDNDLGDFGSPKWRFTGSATISTGPIQILWNVSFRSKTFADAQNRARVLADGNFDDDIEEARAIHRLSVSYDWETWRFTFSVRNVFD